VISPHKGFNFKKDKDGLEKMGKKAMPGLLSAGK
jgi:hypothetical protein